MNMDHINLVVRELDRMSAFFQRLGFVVEARDRLSGEWISDIVGLRGVEAEYVKLVLPGDRVRLELIRYDRPGYDLSERTGEAHQPGFRHLAFAVKDLDATVASLGGKDVEWFSEPQTYTKTGKRLVYFRGPEGVLLELAQYPE